MVHGSKVSSDSSTEEVAQRDLGGEMGEQQLTTETSAAPQNRYPLMSKAQEITDSTARLGGGNLLPIWEMEANLKSCKVRFENAFRNPIGMLDVPGTWLSP